MNENFNRQFILFDYKQLDDRAFLNFVGTSEFRTFLLLLRYVWRGGNHRLGLDELYQHKKLLVAAVGRGFLAEKLSLQDETRVSKHLKELEDLKIIQRMRTGRETIFVVGEWIDISEERDGSAKKEWFYYERVFGKTRLPDPSKETRKGSDEGLATSDVAQNTTSDVQKTPHQTWLKTSPQMWRNEPRSNKEIKINNINTVNVNADKEKEGVDTESKTDLRKLPDLDQPKEKTQSIADEIAIQLGDTHSQAFYYLVAAKIPERFIRQKLSELRQGGARSPAKVFASIVRNYAAEKLAEQKIQSISLAKQGVFRYGTHG